VRFFRRQQKNRRLGREYVLDVKLRSSQVRAARSRLAFVAGATMLALAGIVFLVWRGGSWALDRLVYENPAFALHQLDLQTDGVISTEQLRNWAGIKGDENLLALDLATVKKKLERIPYVQSVSVERILPHTLRIRVIEREPIVQIYAPRAPGTALFTPIVYHLDANGCVMPPLEPRQRSIPANPAAEQLPLLANAKLPDLQPGKFLDVPQVRSALQLVLSFDRSAMAQFVDLKRIDASSSEVLVVTTGQGADITFGLNDMDRQMRRWYQIYDMAQRTGKGIASLDLAVGNNIPMRDVAASSLPPTPPKVPKLYRNKKRHV
jgi:cell division septal protein FtsQ